ncbi:MAG: 50S ribosomal protein L18 [Candidatus Pacebacteria bacterium]|nr:50S ribosomal protein L18 [Candidatus Paceibacterota bacterium]
MSRQNTQEKKMRIKRKVRKLISGTADRPRMSVFRSNNFSYAQLIDDVAQVTLVASNDMNRKKETKMQGAISVGQEVAKLAQAKGIKAVVFDRNGFKYAGRIKALADAAREAGLQF